MTILQVIFNKFRRDIFQQDLKGRFQKTTAAFLFALSSLITTANQNDAHFMMAITDIAGHLFFDFICNRFSLISEHKILIIFYFLYPKSFKIYFYYFYSFIIVIILFFRFHSFFSRITSALSFITFRANM